MIPISELKHIIASPRFYETAVLPAEIKLECEKTDFIIHQLITRVEALTAALKFYQQWGVGYTIATDAINQFGSDVPLK